HPGPDGGGKLLIPPLGEPGRCGQYRDPVVVVDRWLCRQRRVPDGAERGPQCSTVDRPPSKQPGPSDAEFVACRLLVLAHRRQGEMVAEAGRVLTTQLRTEQLNETLPGSCPVGDSRDGRHGLYPSFDWPAGWQ